MEKTSILVVEDDTNAREAICRVVESCGCVAVGTKSFQQALEKASVHLIDAAITDWDLNTEKSGVDVGRALQEIDANFLLVFITGKCTSHLKRATVDLNVHCVLEKPVSLKTLQTLVMELSAIVSAKKKGIPADSVW